jgi:hypothetical protein
MTDTALNNPLVTSVLAIKSGADVVALSTSNPLPNSPSACSSQATANFLGQMFTCRLTVAAVSAKYSAAQIWNPSSNTKTLVVNSLSGYNGSGSISWSIVPRVTAALTTSGGTIFNNKAGGAAAGFELRGANLDAPTASPDYNITVAATTFAGTGLRADGSMFFTIPAGYGLQLEHNTTNVALNIFATVAEIAP